MSDPIQKFIERLTDRLDFRKYGDGDGEWEWKCGRDGDRLAYAKELAAEMGLDLEAIRGHYCCCDCELVFNLGGN